ncbi:hypothetical protein, partial [Neobacillus niacini]|uniref:hypothetical protein n=1 Tax=Neobacillus niacini TaxID=86668 RepID=UPI0021CB6260
MTTVSNLHNIKSVHIEVHAQIVEKGYISRQFFILMEIEWPILLKLPLLGGLLISVPGASL